MTPTDTDIQTPTQPTSRRRRRTWFWPAAAVVLLAGTASVFLVNEPAPVAATVAEPAAARVMQLHPMEVVTVEPQLMEELVKVSGTIHPAQEAAIAAQVSGLAEAVNVRPGDVVEQGQLLVEVGTTDLQLTLDQQRSTLAATAVQLRAAEASLARTTQLAGKGLAATTTLDDAQAQVDQLNATMATQQTQVAQAQTNLDRARVVAPFGGVVASRSIEPGQIVNPGTTMLSLVDLSSVRVEVVAALSQSAKIVPGQSVRLNVQGMGDTVTGTVDRVSPIAEAGTRSILVYLTLDNPDGALRGGMFVSGNIVVRAEDNVLAVPAEAVLTRDDATYVMAVVDGVAEEKIIETGPSWGASALVQARSGLRAGDVIVGTSLTGLNDGAAVSIAGI